jgi:protein-tyrosine phosphatase
MASIMGQRTVVTQAVMQLLDARHLQLRSELQMVAQGRRKGAVLVHCYAGQSRSVALVIAYLCAYFNMSLAEAYNVVVAARPTARPNAGMTLLHVS